MKKKYFYLLFIVILTVLITGCGSDNSNVNGDDSNYSDSQQSCATGWYESGKCCKAFSTGRYVDEYGECPARSVPGYEVPGRGYAQNMCFTIQCN